MLFSFNSLIQSSVYVNIGNQAADTATLAFTFTGASTIRMFDIKVTQVDCNSQSRQAISTNIQLISVISLFPSSFLQASRWLPAVHGGNHRTHRDLQLPANRRRNSSAEPGVREYRKILVNLTNIDGVFFQIFRLHQTGRRILLRAVHGTSVTKHLLMYWNMILFCCRSVRTRSTPSVWTLRSRLPWWIPSALRTTSLSEVTVTLC